MKVTQVDKEYVVSHMDSENLYRLLVCDDSHGKTGKKHYSARIKPVRNLSVAEFTESIDTENYGFILIEED